MKKVTATEIMKKTKPFFVIRALVQLVITLILMAGGILGALLCIWAAARSGGLSIFLFLFVFGGLLAFLRIAKRYILYMVKAAHIAAITEFLKTGEVPVTEGGYKGVVAYGTEKIKNNFGAANIAFAADALISGATRQIMKWVNKAQNLFSFIPGSQNIFAFFNFVLSTALNFIDEAVLSYVFWHSEEKSGFKKACDGLVYYAQSWKSMLKGALKVGAFVWVLRVVSFIAFYAIFTVVAGAFFSVGGFFFAVILAFVLLYGLETVVVEPYATCIMINDYHKAIENEPLKADLHGKLCSVSKKFRELFKKSGQPEPSEEAFSEPATPAFAGAGAGAATGPSFMGVVPGIVSAVKASAPTPDAQPEAADFRFCVNCGSKVARSTNFCPSCGTAVQ